MANELRQPSVHHDAFAEHSAKLREHMAEMKAEHEVLKRMLTKVSGAPPSTASHAFDIATELALYLEKHFAAEENFMDWLKFPHRVSHKVNHKQVTSILKDATKQCASHVELWSFIGSFLTRWLKDHIDHEDSRILLYVHEKFGRAASRTQHD